LRILLLANYKESRVSRPDTVLSRRCSGSFSRRISNRIASNHNYFAAKRWRRLCREERSQNRKCLRYKRNGDDHGHGCTLHVRRS